MTRSSMTCESSWMTSESRRAASETEARASRKSPARMAILLPKRYSAPSALSSSLR